MVLGFWYFFVVMNKAKYPSFVTTLVYQEDAGSEQP